MIDDFDDVETMEDKLQGLSSQISWLQGTVDRLESLIYSLVFAILLLLANSFGLLQWIRSFWG